MTRTCKEKTLTHADAVVQLSRYIEILISRSVSRLDERTVVCPYHCDIAVFPTAELRIVVACLRIGRCSR